MEDFDDDWELFSQVDGNSDFDYLSRAIFKFRRLQGIPKSRFFMFFLRLYPGLSQRTPWTRLFAIFMIFENFRVPLDTPLGVIFNIFVERLKINDFYNRTSPQAPPDSPPQKTLRRLGHSTSGALVK